MRIITPRNLVDEWNNQAADLEAFAKSAAADYDDKRDAREQASILRSCALQLATSLSAMRTRLRERQSKRCEEAPHGPA